MLVLQFFMCCIRSVQQILNDTVNDEAKKLCIIFVDKQMENFSIFDYDGN